MNRDKMSTFLCSLRKEKGLTQQDVAEIFNISFQAVSKWEKGESIPDIELLEKISSFYDVSIEEILNGKKNEVEPTCTDSSITSSNEHKETIHIPNKMINIILGSLLIILTIGLYFLPFIKKEWGAEYVTYSGYYLLGNYINEYGSLILLITFTLSMALGIFDILIGVFGNKCKSLIYFRNTFIFVITGCYIGYALSNVFINYNSGFLYVGGYLILIISFIYLISILFIPSYREEHRFINKSYEMKDLNINIFMFSILISLFILRYKVGYNEKSLTTNLVFSIFLLLAIVLTVLNYIFKNKFKVLKIISLIVLFASCFSLIFYERSLYPGYSYSFYLMIYITSIVFIVEFANLIYYLILKKLDRK